MSRHHEHVFRLPLAAVLRCWTEPAMLSAMMAAQGSRDVAVKVENALPDQVEIAMSRRVPVDAPRLIRAFTGAWLTLDHRDLWQRDANGGWTGARSAAPRGLAARGKAEIRLLPDGADGCVCQAELRVESSAPLVAAMVEALMLRDSLRLLGEEFAWIDAHGAAAA